MNTRRVKSLSLIFLLCLLLTLSACVYRANPNPANTPPSAESPVPPLPEIPEVLSQLLKPEFYNLLGQSRRDIRPNYRIEMIERDIAFWYPFLGHIWAEPGANVFISYNIDGMSYDGLCDYISGEIELITDFPKGTLFADFEKELNLNADGADQFSVFYNIGEWTIYAEFNAENPDVVTRITVKAES